MGVQGVIRIFIMETQLIKSLAVGRSPTSRPSPLLEIWRAQSPSPRTTWLVFLVTSPDPDTPWGPTGVSSPAEQRHSYHLGHSKCFWSSCQKPRTKIEYFLLYYGVSRSDSPASCPQHEDGITDANQRLPRR